MDLRLLHLRQLPLGRQMHYVQGLSAPHRAGKSTPAPPNVGPATGPGSRDHERPAGRTTNLGARFHFFRSPTFDLLFPLGLSQILFSRAEAPTSTIWASRPRPPRPAPANRPLCTEQWPRTTRLTCMSNWPLCNWQTTGESALLTKLKNKVYFYTDAIKVWYTSQNCVDSFTANYLCCITVQSVRKHPLSRLRSLAK